MEAYPPEYVQHNLPLVVLSGLGERDDGQARPLLPRQESGSRITLRSEDCDAVVCGPLLNQILEHDGSQDAWNPNTLQGPSGTLKYRIKTVGRSFTLPPRKAAPLPQSPNAEGGPGPLGHYAQNTTLHSPLSPLSPGSPIFPDGLFTPLWLNKHQDKVPALLLAFFDISGRGEASADEKVQIDINHIRTTLNRSGYKTRFAAVMVSDQSILDAPELEERLAAVRRATTLDPKTGLFFMPPMSSPAEIAAFVQNIFTTLQPVCVEHYRDLTKHARRKKARGGPLPSTNSPIGGASQSLSTLGWNVRYDVKQAIFAEFRQEMDVADRHYSAAIDDLFNSEGILEATPTWSPRWDEARLLCDALAVRVVRCQLWTNLTTGAVVFWLNYQARMKDLINRRGKGSRTYGWAAWEARWAMIMASLVQRVQLPSLYGTEMEESTVDKNRQAIFSPPERAVERLPPFQLLHHPAYWQRLAIHATEIRRERALLIPEEDRIPPAQLPASAVASKNQTHDLFLVPHPHNELALSEKRPYDFLADLGRMTEAASQEFVSRDQARFSEQLQLRFARKLADAQRYEDAIALLKPLWQNCAWRFDEWHDLYAELVSLLIVCATEQKDGKTLVAATWETLALSTATDEQFTDLAKTLDNLAFSESSVAVEAEDGNLLCPFRFSFAFANKNGYVGEPLECQLTVRSVAPNPSEAISLSTLAIAIGSAHTVTIRHKRDESKNSSALILTDLSDGEVIENGQMELGASLKFSPGQTRIFSFFLNFRCPEELTIREITLTIETERFRLEHRLTSEYILRSGGLYLEQDGVVQQRLLPHLETRTVTVLPKPPKLAIQLHGLKSRYYTDERLQFAAEFLNDESEGIAGTARLVVGSSIEESITALWVGDRRTSELELSKIGAADTTRAEFTLDGPSDPSTVSFILEVSYTLQSDTSTKLVKSYRMDMDFVVPFDTKYDFGPRFDGLPWPSYFDARPKGTEDEPAGIVNRWLLGCQLRSRALDDLVIHKTELHLDEASEYTKCTLDQQDHHLKHQLVRASSLRTEYEFTTQKFSLDDRRPSSAELSLAVTWARNSEAQPVTTILNIPRLTLPSAEPRVLCSLGKASSADEVVVYYHLENPSTHFLTFAVTMEANEEFGFSGPKFRTLSLAPLSRYQLEYRLVVHDEGEDAAKKAGAETKRYVWPALQVLDSYYQKTLKIHAGGAGVKYDEKRGLGVLVQG